MRYHLPRCAVSTRLRCKIKRRWTRMSKRAKATRSSQGARKAAASPVDHRGYLPGGRSIELGGNGTTGGRRALIQGCERMSIRMRSQIPRKWVARRFGQCCLLFSRSPLFLLIPSTGITCIELMAQIDNERSALLRTAASHKERAEPFGLARDSARVRRAELLETTSLLMC